MTSTGAGGKRNLYINDSEMDEFMLCVYQVKVDDNIFHLHDKDSDGLVLQLDQNNIDNMVYLIENDENEVIKIADANYTFRVQPNTTLTVF